MNKRVALVLVFLAALIAGALLWRSARGIDPLVVDASSEGKQVTTGAESLVQPRVPETEEASRRVHEPTPAQPGPELSQPTPELAGDVDIGMHVHIVDAVTGGGVAGVRIERSNEEGPDAVSDADGRCVLRFAARQRTTITLSEDAPLPLGFCRVHAQGYGITEFRETEGHEREDQALEVRLSHSATLVASLLRRADLSAAAYSLHAKVEALELFPDEPLVMEFDFGAIRFQADCDAAGGVRLEGLPANVPLTVAVFQGPKSLRVLPEPLRLEPGEERRMEVDLGAACRLRGRVVDSAGAPMPMLGVWLAARDEYPKAQFQEYERKDCTAATSTDSLGRFDLGETPAGSYWLGPAPLPDSLGIAGVNVAVDIAADEGSKEVELRVQRGLFIHGTVVAPDGTPMTQSSQVSARSRAWHQVMEFTKEDGSFVLGPLVDANYTLEALDAGGFDASLPVEVAAGAKDIVLTLRTAASMSGRVVASRGGPGIPATLITGYPDDERGVISMRKTDPGGGFRCTGLTPGRISLTAVTADGSIGMIPSVDLAPGEDRPELEILVSPGAKLRFLGTSKAKMYWAQVFQDGTLVANPNGDSLTAGVIVPAGELVVRVRLSTSREPIEQKVRVAVGEDREVVVP